MSTKVPSYRHQNPSGKAVVTISGRDYYLGKFNSAESNRKYKTLVGEYLANPSFGIASASVTMRQILEAYVKHADK